ncbi:MAG: glycosyltransferase [Bacteroidia bacterium]|nr:glycosyltransferase [Bacteroidia bacterium]
MKKVLFIAYQFPPMGGPGVHRSIQFAKNLKDFGYEPIVLTVLIDDIKKSGSTIDTSLLNALPNDLQIERVASGIPFNFINFLHKIKLYRLFWFLLYPFFWERQARWPRIAFERAKKLIQQHNIELIYTSSGPFSPLILGKLLKEKLNVKWVADLRDPYTDAYAWSYPSKFHWYMSRWKEKKWLMACDSLIVNTPEVKKLYTKRGLKKPNDIFVITNGF